MPPQPASGKDCHMQRSPGKPDGSIPQGYTSPSKHPTVHFPKQKGAFFSNRFTRQPTTSCFPADRQKITTMTNPGSLPAVGTLQFSRNVQILHKKGMEKVPRNIQDPGRCRCWRWHGQRGPKLQEPLSSQQQLSSS